MNHKNATQTGGVSFSGYGMGHPHLFGENISATAFV